MSFPLPLQTALISAGTAAAVALLLDLLVRPYLESRKDWVVSSASEKRKLIRLTTAVFIFDQWCMDSLPYLWRPDRILRITDI